MVVTKMTIVKTRPPIISITDNAVARMKFLLQGRNKASLGIKVGVKKGGCSGLTYVVEFADNEEVADIKLEKDGIVIYIDPKAELFILGTEMDYVKEQFSEGFVFKNPNEKGRCGCGESFNV